MANIKFISYDGKYPNFCCGNLTLEINGKTTIFGDNGYAPFWVTGGSCGFSKDWSEEHVEKAPWKLSMNYGGWQKCYPNKELYTELIRVFNENVPQGCCGGCL